MAGASSAEPTAATPRVRRGGSSTSTWLGWATPTDEFRRRLSSGWAAVVLVDDRRRNDVDLECDRACTMGTRHSPRRSRDRDRARTGTAGGPSADVPAPAAEHPRRVGDELHR